MQSYCLSSSFQLARLETYQFGNAKSPTWFADRSTHKKVLKLSYCLRPTGTYELMLLNVICLEHNVYRSAHGESWFTFLVLRLERVSNQSFETSVKLQLVFESCSAIVKQRVPPAIWGAQWLSGRVHDSRPKGSGFEPHRRHCVVVLEQDTFILA